jgi:hypothetical protein
MVTVLVCLKGSTPPLLRNERHSIDKWSTVFAEDRKQVSSIFTVISLLQSLALSRVILQVLFPHFL